MTIRSKLFSYLIVTIIGILAIGGSSLVGMRFVQGKLNVLTEQSTPYQLKTIELQRAIQEYTSTLLKAGLSSTPAELAAARAESDQAGAEVTRLASGLRQLKGGSEDRTSTKVGKLMDVGRELYSTTEERLAAAAAARGSDEAMKARLADIGGKLDQLSRSMDKLQKGSARQLSASSDTAREITQKLMSLTQARDAVKEVTFAVSEINRAEGKKAVLIARSKMDTGFSEFAKNRLVTANDPAIKETGEAVAEAKKLSLSFLEQKGAVLGDKGNEELKKNYEQVVQGLTGKLANALVAIDQSVAIATEKYNQENRNHETSLKGSSAAGDTLAMTGELISLGLDINGRIRELFVARSSADLQRIAADLQGRCAAASGVATRLMKTLGSVGKVGEQRLVQGVGGSLGEIQRLAFAANGVVQTLQRQLTVDQKAQELNGRLRELVADQRAAGQKGITSAQEEQERAVASVNRVVRGNVSTVLAIGLTVLVVGLVMSRFLSRAITAPIRELRTIAEGFGNGDFSRRMNEKSKDEFGELAVHFNQATAKINEITGRLTVAIHALGTNASQLSGTARTLHAGAREQASQTTQAVTAISQMSQSIDGVACHAQSAAAASKESQETAASGNAVVEKTVRCMDAIAHSVQDAAATIGVLGTHSEKIGDVISAIQEIADQTNLLALNAAIEAARAGEHGQGFAVVSEEVRRLATRTTEMTGQITAVIREMQGSTAQTVNAMESGTERVRQGQEQTAQAISSLQSIVTASSNAVDMVHQIAAATEEQAAVTREVTAAMEQIATVTSQTELSVQEVAGAATELARLAEELDLLAGWFQTDAQRVA